jgi:hypothetical protein
MDESEIKFKYQKITNHFFGQRMHLLKFVNAVFALIALVLMVLEGRPLEYEIKSYILIFTSLSFSVIVHFSLKPYDSIFLTDEHLVIKKFTKRAVMEELVKAKFEEYRLSELGQRNVVHNG